mmetsp:Transcript_4074/g.12174  ORF Transcript_4074/g.12174 Transcript_4074/m.12174 type:complete len:237 (+) Transcript_4074:1778-2488(+)
MRRKTSCSDGTERPYERAPAAGSAVSSSSKSGAKAAAASVGSATATSSGCSCSTLASGTCRWTSARSCALVGGPPGGRATVRCCARPYRRFREREVPTARSRPLCITAIRSPRASASSRKCVVSTTVRPRLTSRSSAQMARRECGSMPEVGSSRKRVRAPPAGWRGPDEWMAGCGGPRTRGVCVRSRPQATQRGRACASGRPTGCPSVPRAGLARGRHSRASPRGGRRRAAPARAP